MSLYFDFEMVSDNKKRYLIRYFIDNSNNFDKKSLSKVSFNKSSPNSQEIILLNIGPYPKLQVRRE